MARKTYYYCYSYVCCVIVISSSSSSSSVITIIIVSSLLVIIVGIMHWTDHEAQRLPRRGVHVNAELAKQSAMQKNIQAVAQGSNLRFQAESVIMLSLNQTA